MNWTKDEQRYDRWTSLPQMFFEQAEAAPDQPLFWHKTGDTWTPVTWRAAQECVTDLARGLVVLGLQPGDRVLLVSENRPEWGMAHLAIMTAGGISVPAYTTNTPADHLHVLQDSGARMAIVSTPRLAATLLPALRDYGQVDAAICMELPDDDAEEGQKLHAWTSVIARGRDARDRDARDRDGAAATDAPALAGGPGTAQRGDTAVIIYTSGTGGTPRGVMLGHGAILANCQGAFRLLTASGLCGAPGERERFLSFLPLSHSYEHTAGFFVPLSMNGEIYYAESADKLVANMQEVRPTLMTAVPRLYETVYQRIVAEVARKGGLGARLFRQTLILGRKRYETGRLSLPQALLDSLLERLVRARIAARFGGQLKAFVSGGAPLDYEIGVFFTALGVRLLQGYGQTETAPVVSCNPPDDVRLRTVGPPLAGVTVKLADDGEILVRGELTMNGYWRNPEATAQTLRDGWVHTGDIGDIGEDGYIRITDRKKDMIVNSGGDNIAPQRVEGRLTLEPEIGQAMVYGDRHPHLVALVVPAAELLETVADKPDEAETALRPAIGKAIARANKRLSSIEQVRGFTLTTTPFSTDNAMLTPSLKIRRHEIRQRFGDALEALYAKGRKP